MSTAAKVFATFGVIVVLVFFAGLMVPGISDVQAYRNHTSAISSIHTLLRAEQNYQTEYPSRGFSCSFANLASAKLISDDLAAGVKAGYRFALANCNSANSATVTRFKITAVPVSLGRTGYKGFCADEKNIITVDSDGGSNCTRELQ